MAETIRLVEYFYIMTPDKPGEAHKALHHMKQSGVNLLAFSAFPKGKQTQMDFIPEDAMAFRAAAKAARWKVKGPKKGFVITGDDRIGALCDVVEKLANARINITATDAVCAGMGRYGVILWVKPRDVKKAAQALGAV